MRKVKYFILKIGIVGLNILYTFIKIFPTQKKILFLSRQSNTPSLDYQILYDALKKKYKDYKIVMYTKKIENKIAYAFHMIKQMYEIATSKLVLIDSYCINISVLKHKKSLRVIQLWHAIGCMKKFGYANLDTPEGQTTELAKIMKLHRNYDAILISSYGFINDYYEGFRYPKDKIKEIPLPRVDYLLDPKNKEKIRKKLYKRIPELKNKKNILYCSTFRRDSDGSDEHVKRLIKEIDFNKYNLLFKPHPLNNVVITDKRVITDFENSQEALFVADYVICDYSSMIYEIGLLKLPVYLYAYDWKEYSSKRELNLDFTKVPALFTDDPKKIMHDIENNIFDYKAFDKFVKANVNVPKDGCTNEIIKLIDSYLNE
ncbi:MAG: CDP-glycerol glycerophosphotransferase family protein [Bacilli bacterium]|nr:CDP-glycerol glycerophosphotransferase family protein [Bacilli bacterium]